MVAPWIVHHETKLPSQPEAKKVAEAAPVAEKTAPKPKRKSTARKTTTKSGD
tara:strand:- start:3749 stop:3904 length:156 start_codon:yes stop_codon:yes gene_type:complete